MICSRPNQAHAEKRGAFPLASLALQRARSRGPCKCADRSACEDHFAHDAHARGPLFHDVQPNSNGMDEAVFLRSTVRTQDALPKPHPFISPHTRVRKRRWHPFPAAARRAPVFIWDRPSTEHLKCDGTPKGNTEARLELLWIPLLPEGFGDGAARGT
jgi:hypothetical protein